MLFSSDYRSQRVCIYGVVFSLGRRNSCAITYLEIAGAPGLEPRYTGPEPVVLPLDDTPIF